MTHQKDPAAVKLGRRGGKARGARMTPEQRRAHAVMMVQKREANRAARKVGNPGV